jgi:hypothetical protein
VMRISVTNWSTDADDVDRSVEAILRCFASVREALSSTNEVVTAHAN